MIKIFQRLPKTMIILPLGRLIAMLSGIIISATSGPTFWGQHVFVRTGVDTSVGCTRGGLELASYKHLNVGNENESDIVGAMFFVSFVLNLISILAFSIYLIIYENNDLDYFHAMMVLWSGIFSFFIGASSALTAPYRNEYTIALEQLFAPAARLLSFFVIYAIYKDILFSLGFSLLLSSIITSIFSAKYIINYNLKISINFRDFDRLVFLTKEIFSLCANSFLANLASRVDIIIGAAALSFTSLGTYAIISSFISLISLSNLIISRYFVPEISSLLSKNDIEAALLLTDDTKNLALTSVCTMSLLSQGGLYIFSQMIGIEYNFEVATAAALLSLGPILIGSAGISGYFLSIGGGQVRERIVLMRYAGIFSILSFSLSTHWGITGLAAGVALAALWLIVDRQKSVNRSLGRHSDLYGNKRLIRSIYEILIHLMPFPLFSYIFNVDMNTFEISLVTFSILTLIIFINRNNILSSKNFFVKRFLKI